MEIKIATEAEIAYCAGLYEGEGSLSRYGNRSPALRIQMTDLEPLQRVQSIMGGLLNGPYRNAKRPTHKEWWHWCVGNWEDVVRVAKLMRPWLGPRRAARIDEVIAALPDRFRKPRAYRACNYEPIASVGGYLKHRKRGERACEVCRKSARMYYAIYLPKWRAAKAAKLAEAITSKSKSDLDVPSIPTDAEPT